VLNGEASDGIREFHRGYVVSLQQPAPPERREHVGEIPHRQMPLTDQVHPVHGAGQLNQVVSALFERRGFRLVGRAVGVDRAQLFAMHGGQARLGLTLHPVAGGQKLPADARVVRDIPVQRLRQCQWGAGHGREVVLDRRRHVVLVPVRHQHGGVRGERARVVTGRP
jgi:hypothetical protein